MRPLLDICPGAAWRRDPAAPGLDLVGL